MERKMLNIRWQDHISNQTVKEKSNLPRAVENHHETKMEMGWACGSHERQLGAWPHNVETLPRETESRLIQKTMGWRDPQTSWQNEELGRSGKKSQSGLIWRRPHPAVDSKWWCYCLQSRGGHQIILYFQKISHIQKEYLFSLFICTLVRWYAEWPP